MLSVPLVLILVNLVQAAFPFTEFLQFRPFSTYKSLNVMILPGAETTKRQRLSAITTYKYNLQMLEDILPEDGQTKKHVTTTACS